ncbi:MAG: DUF2330 domain-containing protein, partial [Candidatus Thermoplasmatota archaeon]
MKKKLCLILILLFTILLVNNSNSADRGLIGPPQIELEENAQNAIVAWNGTEEVLILSTDIKSSERSLALGILPLPSQPLEIKEGSFESFTNLQKIVNEKLKEHYLKRGYSLEDANRMGNESGIQIVYRNIIGAHNITIVRVDNLTYFIDWAINFSVQHGLENINFSESFKSSIENYLNMNIRYFVFDVIETNETQQSINPIIYRFRTDFLYYPLNITAFSPAGETYSQVNVFAITKGLIKKSAISEYRHYIRHYINLTKEELNDICPDIYQLFDTDPFLTGFNYYGILSYLQKDITIKEQDLASPNLQLEFDNTVLVRVGESKIVNVKVKNIGDEDLYVRLNIEDGIVGIKHKWFSIQPWSARIEKGNETIFEV